MMLPHLHQRDEQDDASRGNAQSPYRSQGGATGVDAFDDIHRRHMCAKLRCRLTGPECRFMAEAVEEVRTIKFYATIVRMSRVDSNIDSTGSLILKHCFKSFERPDFFNSLSHERTFEADA